MIFLRDEDFVGDFGFGEILNSEGFLSADACESRGEIEFALVLEFELWLSADSC